MQRTEPAHYLAQFSGSQISQSFLIQCELLLHKYLPWVCYMEKFSRYQVVAEDTQYNYKPESWSGRHRY